MQTATNTRDNDDISRTIGLLGGEKAIRAQVKNTMDAHQVLLDGLPSSSIQHLITRVGFLGRGDALQKAIGISIRTLQRHKSGKTRQLLSLEQSNRTWRFAEIFSHAVNVLGSEPAAEEWMNAPAAGLSQQKPVDLLSTSAGVEAVEDYLTRLEFGVYT